MKGMNPGNFYTTSLLMSPPDLVLFSLSIMFSRFIHAIVSIRISFFFIAL